MHDVLRFPVNDIINMQMNDQLKEKSNMKCSYCRESVLHNVLGEDSDIGQTTRDNAILN